MVRIAARELEGVVAVVTGAASGIGRASARELASRGAHVVAGDIDAASGKAACDALVRAGLHARFLAVDLGDDASIAAFAAALERERLAPAILVNAAGWDRAQPFLDSDFAFIERVVAVNLLGAMKLTRALLPAMVARGAGRIVNVASDAGRVGSSGETAYAGAKGGVIAFTKSVAREMARHAITANCVCPGPTDTPLFRSLPGRLQEGLVRAIPLRRIARPEEVAHAIAFFTAPRSAYVTGQVISVSGGLTMAG